MDKIICDNYVAILKNELIASFGCTEPIVIAYASAKAREVLGEDVVKLELLCSGNVIKNVKSVIVPNSDGERGIPIAAALGALRGRRQPAAGGALRHHAGENSSGQGLRGCRKVHL